MDGSSVAGLNSDALAEGVDQNASPCRALGTSAQPGDEEWGDHAAGLARKRAISGVCNLQRADNRIKAWSEDEKAA